MDLTDLKSNKFYIYGTGYISDRFYAALERMKCTKNVLGFIVTNKNDEMPLQKKGMDIFEVNEIPRDKMIICAVHMIWEEEIRQILNKLNFEKFYFIYEQIFDLDFGTPIKTDVSVKVCSLVRTITRKSFVIPAYYSAIDNFFHPKDNGDILYLKLYEMLTNKESAKKRLKRLHDMIQQYKDRGGAVILTSNIKIDENESVILDGLHRTTLALYFGIHTLKADIYQTKQYYDKWLGRKFYIDENSMNDIYTEDERKRLRCLQKKILCRLTD